MTKIKPSDKAVPEENQEVVQNLEEKVITDTNGQTTQIGAQFNSAAPLAANKSHPQKAHLKKDGEVNHKTSILSSLPFTLETELSKRIVSGIFLIIIALSITLYGEIPFIIFWYLVGVVAYYEWVSMSGCKRVLPVTLLGGILLLFPAYLFSLKFLKVAGSLFIENAINRIEEPTLYLSQISVVTAVAAGVFLYLSFQETRKAQLWMCLGLLYCYILVICLPSIRGNQTAGIFHIIWLFGMVWGTDIGAFFTGRKIGGPKLWPAVSPKKTWSGFFGGLFFGTLIGALISYIVTFTDSYAHSIFATYAGQMLLYSLLGSLLCQLGDLAESGMKRHFNVKDSGMIIPGHGGVLDRIDGLWVVALLLGILILL